MNAPEPGAVEYLTDSHGKVRLAVGNSDGTVRAYRRNQELGQWQKLETPSATKLLPLMASRDDRWAYYAASGLPGSTGDATCLARQALDGSGPLETLSCRTGADLQTLIASADGKEAIAAVFEPDLPVLDVLDTPNRDADLLIALQKSFPGNLTLPISSSLDGSKWVLEVFSDQNPGEFYLYDRTAKTAEKLFSVRENVAPERMAAVAPVRVKARDGVLLHGYLTQPLVGSRAKPATPPPLVVLVHGGPFFVRDHWGYEPDAQLLAAHGYAVLQVNFRGSAGYGDAFINTARGHWGGVMIDDLTDAVRQLIKDGKVDGSRVAIFGASYGGYAALMSAVREPDLYKAVIAYAGVYDLKALKADSDIARSSAGRRYLQRFMGESPEVLAENSPMNYLGQLKAPVFIIHGKADERAPFEQAEKLHAALKGRQHPVEWLSKNDEGHGFIRLKARADLYERLLDFLDRKLAVAPG